MLPTATTITVGFQQIPELSFTTGDEISVMGFKSLSGKWKPVSLLKTAGIQKQQQFHTPHWLDKDLIETDEYSLWSTCVYHNCRACIPKSPLTPTQNGKPERKKNIYYATVCMFLACRLIAESNCQ